ncbi:hypothetical protein [Luteimonas terricola]|uniref:Uncharacterized protein n=1 Tax=Luteimonas terricola TaxID=645597 RepID=A0ABQ2EBX9_9GAMM|nr:hypothetical protein [Luteimonas terricola]GGK04969.1 hypothetical protein GCM10011394_12590 [Luteimonas terricola]
MDRKLNHSLIALSATGLLLAAALLAGTPLSQGGPSGANVMDAADATVHDDTEAARRDGRSARSGRRGLALPYFSFAHGMRRIGG